MIRTHLLQTVGRSTIIGLTFFEWNINQIIPLRIELHKLTSKLKITSYYDVCMHDNTRQPAMCHYYMQETPTSKSLLHVIIASVLYDFLTKLLAVLEIQQKTV